MANSPWTDPAELAKGTNRSKAKCTPKQEARHYGKTAKGKSVRVSHPNIGKMTTQGKAPKPGKPTLPKRK